MIGIDRYGLQISMGMAEHRRHARGSEQAEAPPQGPSPLSAGGIESGSSSTTKLSGILWAIRSEASDVQGNSPEEEFSRMSQMTLAERIRAKILDEHDLSESDLANLSEEQRKAIEDEIALAVKQAYGIVDEAGAGTDQRTPIPLSL